VRRIRNILETIQNGLIAHTSSESNTILPIFTIIGDVKVPSPVFHSFIDVKKANDGNFEVIGIEDAVKNGWLEGNIYIKDCARLKAQIPLELNKKDDWNEFLRSINLSNNVNDESSTN
jgi:CRISPR-associated protein Cst2